MSGLGAFPCSQKLQSGEAHISPNTESPLTIWIIWDWGVQLKWQRQLVPEVHFLWMLKSWHSWLAQCKYGHPSTVALLEFICWIVATWFLWQPSDSLNWAKTLSPASAAAVLGPELRTNPNTPWPHEGLPAHAAPVLDAEYVRGPGLGYGSALRLHGHSQAQPGNWFPSSPPPPNPLKHKRFLTTVTGGRDSTFVLNLHLAVCIYAGFLKTALGMIVVQDKVQFVWHKEDCRERWPGGQYRGSSLGFLIFFFNIYNWL